MRDPTKPEPRRRATRISYGAPDLIRTWAALLVVLASGLGACSHPACEQHVLYAAPAPDGAVIAFIYHRSCGAPGDLGTHVSLVPYDGALHDQAGNVLAVAGDQPVKVSWRDARRLVVTGFRDPIFQRPQPFGAVVIEFPTVAALEAR